METMYCFLKQSCPPHVTGSKNESINSGVESQMPTPLFRSFHSKLKSQLCFDQVQLVVKEWLNQGHFCKMNKWLIKNSLLLHVTVGGEGQLRKYIPTGALQRVTSIYSCHLENLLSISIPKLPQRLYQGNSPHGTFWRSSKNRSWHFQHFFRTYSRE